MSTVDSEVAVLREHLRLVKRQIEKYEAENARLRARVAALEAAVRDTLRRLEDSHQSGVYRFNVAWSIGTLSNTLQHPQDAAAGAGEVRREGDAAKNAVEAAGAKQDGIAEVE